MLCQKCKKNEATGYMERTTENGKTRIYVCPECFKQLQLEMFSSLNDFGLFSGLTGQKNIRGKCSKCGMSLQKIYDTGFVGCEQCYSEFGEQIDGMLKKTQNAVMHTGGSPSKIKQSSESEVEKLESELKRAVAAENYELCLKISQRLKQLKGEIK